MFGVFEQRGDPGWWEAWAAGDGFADCFAGVVQHSFGGGRVCVRVADDEPADGRIGVSREVGQSGGGEETVLSDSRLLGGICRPRG